MPYSRLAQVDGKYLCVGLGNRLVAIRHEAQHRAKLDRVPLFSGTRYRDDCGNAEVFVRVHPGCFTRLPELVPVIINMGILSRGKIGSALSIIGSARDILNAMTQLLEESPTMNLCDNVWCL